MIEIVMIPLVWTWNREAAFMAQQTGKMAEIQAARQKELEDSKEQLADRLADGFSILASHVMEGDNRTFIVYTLHKPLEAQQ